MPTMQAIPCVDVTQAHVCPYNTSVMECRVQYKCDGMQSAIQVWRSAECNTSVTVCRVQYKCDEVQSAIQVWRSAECSTSVTECRGQYKCDGVQSTIQVWWSAECNTSVTECRVQGLRQAAENAVHKEETTADFRRTAVRFISQQTIFQHTHNGLSHAYITVLRGPRSLKSNRFSEQQNGRHCVFSASGVGPTIFSTITQRIKAGNTAN